MIAAKKKKPTSLTVPATVKWKNVTFKVTEVGSSIMKGNTKLTKVVLGKNVTTIGKQAFMGCKKLTAVQLKGKAPSSIKQKAFKNTSPKLVVTAKKLTKKQKAALFKKLKSVGMNKKGKVK